MHEINQEATFQEEVEWHDPQDDSGELIDNVESSEAYPVSEPLFIIFESFRFESQETHKCWIGDSQ